MSTNRCLLSTVITVLAFVFGLGKAGHKRTAPRQLLPAVTRSNERPTLRVSCPPTWPSNQTDSTAGMRKLGTIGWSLYREWCLSEEQRTWPARLKRQPIQLAA